MPITNEKKLEIISSYRRGDSDTGSPEVQIAVLTERISQLTEHVQVHQKDHAGRRGLLSLVSRRRRLLDYLKRKNLETYQNLIQKLGIRK